MQIKMYIFLKHSVCKLFHIFSSYLTGLYSPLSPVAKLLHNTYMLHNNIFLDLTRLNDRQMNKFR